VGGGRGQDHRPVGQQRPPAPPTYPRNNDPKPGGGKGNASSSSNNDNIQDNKIDNNAGWGKGQGRGQGRGKGSFGAYGGRGKGNPNQGWQNNGNWQNNQNWRNMQNNQKTQNAVYQDSAYSRGSWGPVNYAPVQGYAPLPQFQNFPNPNAWNVGGPQGPAFQQAPVQMVQGAPYSALAPHTGYNCVPYAQQPPRVPQAHYPPNHQGKGGKGYQRSQTQYPRPAPVNAISAAIPVTSNPSSSNSVPNIQVTQH